MNDFYKRIEAIPGDDGWWVSSSFERFCELGNKLTLLGMSDDDAIEFLDAAYWAAASCYGD